MLLHWPALTEVVGYRIVSQIYEGLLKFSPQDLSVTPNVAEKREVNEDATSFIFYLRKGAHTPSEPSKKSYINTLRYKNGAFDSLFSVALKETDRRNRFDLLRKADQIALMMLLLCPFIMTKIAA